MANGIEKARKIRQEQSLASHKAEKHGVDLAKEDVKVITSKMLQTMTLRFSGERIMDVLEEGLTATRDVKRKDEDGVTQLVEIPDFRTRHDTMKLILSYTVGMPVQREEKVNYNFDMNDLDEDGLIEKLSESPAMLSKVKAMIADAELKSANGKVI